MKCPVATITRYILYKLQFTILHYHRTAWLTRIQHVTFDLKLSNHEPSYYLDGCPSSLTRCSRNCWVIVTLPLPALFLCHYEA